MSTKKLRSIREYLFRNGRYLDVARWNFHFEDGDPREVIKALAVYQNNDGGFGHGIEPDNPTPYSNPIATWMAISILRELKFPKFAESMIQKIMDYLVESIHRETLTWNPCSADNDVVPHAPWWDDSGEVSVFGYNPTAEFIGIILRFSAQDSIPWTTAKKALDQMLETVTTGDYDYDEHELRNFLHLIEDLKASRHLDLLSTELVTVIESTGNRILDENRSKYFNNIYTVSPAWYIESVHDSLYERNKDLCSSVVEHLEQTVTEEGYWEINWDWGDRIMTERAILDWRGSMIVSNMLFIEKIVKRK